VLPNCNAVHRCNVWKGPLERGAMVGCMVNILRFIGEMDDETAKYEYQKTLLLKETPFATVINHLNKSRNMFKEKIIPIYTKELLTIFFDTMENVLPLNSCIIVRLERSKTTLYTPSHSILLSKDKRGVLWTYEPYQSMDGKCSKRRYKGVSDNFFNSYQKYNYVNASILTIKRKFTKKNMGDYCFPIELALGPS
jgi:hypothetical protein